MSYKTKLILSSAVSATIAGIVWYTSYFTVYGATLYYFGIVLSIIFIVFVFVKKEVFVRWRRFGVIYILISILIVSIPLQPTGSFGPTSFIDNEALGTLLALLFLLISLGLIIYKTTQLKEKEKLPDQNTSDRQNLPNQP